ncbi:MAG: hypothetical protein U1F54_18815 [Burkholderiales bacterium]
MNTSLAHDPREAAPADQAEPATYSTTSAAAYLHQALPGQSADYWMRFLRNNRRPERSPGFRITVDMVGGVGIYQRAALDQFVAFERARRFGGMQISARAARVLDAFGVGTSGGGATGRKLKVVTISPQVSDDDGVGFVQLVIDDPLRAYRLSPPEALDLARQLAESAHRAHAWGKEAAK